MTVEEAASLIRLSGLEPDKDVEIRFTGLRQGEKLDEELMEDPAGSSRSEIALRAIDSSAVVRRLRELVPTFRPAAAHEAPAANPSSAA